MTKNTTKTTFEVPDESFLINEVQNNIIGCSSSSESEPPQRTESQSNMFRSLSNNLLSSKSTPNNLFSQTVLNKISRGEYKNPINKRKNLIVEYRFGTSSKFVNK